LLKDEHELSERLPLDLFPKLRNCLPSFEVSELRRGRTTTKMSAKTTKGPGGKKPASAATNLIAGGGAGMMEALVCHPLDTIKVRMQLSKRSQRGVSSSLGYHTLH
jgi:hypothetical protein